jgi:hypothetical protein
MEPEQERAFRFTEWREVDVLEHALTGAKRAVVTEQIRPPDKRYRNAVRYSAQCRCDHKTSTVEYCQLFGLPVHQPRPQTAVY